jgi:hypothetical protein
VAHDARPTRFGRQHVPEPPSGLGRMHFAAQAQVPIDVVSHQIRIPVLDQEDLAAQGIDTSVLIPGAPKADALGSCVANATTAALSAGLTLAELNGLLPPDAPILTDSPVDDEEFAILLYHQLTDWTGDPASEWPPEDCGSSGFAACQFLEQQDLIAGHKIAHGAENILSLMQGGPLIVGQPWFSAWMNPGADGFIDGDGTAAGLMTAIDSGVAGGHETCWYGIEEIGYTLDGGIDPQKTVIRFRNSWGTGWNQDGSGLVHLSTYVMLGQYCDFRQLTFAAE